MSTIGRSTTTLQRKALPLLAAAALTATIGLTAVLGTGCGPKEGAPAGDDVAATVNGKDIPVSEIDRAIDAQIKQSGPGTPALTPVSLAAARLQILDQLISEEVLYQRAQKEGVVPNDDELNQKIAQEKQGRGWTEEMFKKALEQSGQTEEQFRDQVRRQLAIQKLRDKIAAKVPSPSEGEVRKYFDENRAQAVAPRGFELSVITVDPRDNGARDDAKSPQDAQAKAQRVVATLRGGSDFATVAAAQSEDPNSSKQGGLIGFFSDEKAQQTFGPDIAARFFKMQPGEITEPIPSPDPRDGRWFVFKMGEKREQQRELTFEEVQQSIAQQITEQRKQVVLSALMIDAVNSANVKNHLAAGILEHPDTFGALRPSPLTERRPEQPAPAQPAAPASQAQPAPSNANAAKSPATDPAAPPANANGAK
jgi:parvulin-like peptidyl-prolyl isomerase